MNLPAERYRLLWIYISNRMSVYLFVRPIGHHYNERIQNNTMLYIICTCMDMFENGFDLIDSYKSSI